MIPDLAIVGAGLAGSALAIRAAQAGGRVLLVERETGPHDKVCGEFLSREAVLHLHALGLDPLALGGVPIDHVGLSRGRLATRTRLPFSAVGLSRRILDEALIARAQACGAIVRRGVVVRAIASHESGQRLRLDRGDDIAAGSIVLATGKHELRSHPRQPGRQNDLVGFKQHLRLSDAQRVCLDGASELTLFPGGYAGLQMVSHHHASLCLLVRSARLKSLGGTWPALRAAILAGSPLLALRLSGAEPVQDRPLSIARIPYGLVSTLQDGLWRLGDQAAVIPSFTGDGMSIALHSAAVCARLIEQGASPDALQRALAAELSPQIRLATTLSHAAVRAWVQHAAVAAAHLLPALADRIAARTRIPEPALARALGHAGAEPGPGTPAPATGLLASSPS